MSGEIFLASQVYNPYLFPCPAFYSWATRQRVALIAYKELDLPYVRDGDSTCEKATKQGRILR